MEQQDKFVINANQPVYKISQEQREQLTQQLRAQAGFGGPNQFDFYNQILTDFIDSIENQYDTCTVQKWWYDYFITVRGNKPSSAKSYVSTIRSVIYKNLPISNRTYRYYAFETQNNLQNITPQTRTPVKINIDQLKDKIQSIVYEDQDIYTKYFLFLMYTGFRQREMRYTINIDTLKVDGNVLTFQGLAKSNAPPDTYYTREILHGKANLIKDYIIELRKNKLCKTTFDENGNFLNSKLNKSQRDKINVIIQKLVGDQQFNLFQDKRSYLHDGTRSYYVKCCQKSLLDQQQFSDEEEEETMQEKVEYIDKCKNILNHVSINSTLHYAIIKDTKEDQSNKIVENETVIETVIEPVIETVIEPVIETVIEEKVVQKVDPTIEENYKKHIEEKDLIIKQQADEIKLLREQLHQQMMYNMNMQNKLDNQIKEIVFEI